MSAATSEQQDGYSLVPTNDTMGRGLHDEMWTEDYPLDNQAVIEHCREHGWTGAHVFTGPVGAIIGAEGREDNYHGWIDARPGIESGAATDPLPTGRELQDTSATNTQTVSFEDLRLGDRIVAGRLVFEVVGSEPIAFSTSRSPTGLVWSVAVKSIPVNSGLLYIHAKENTIFLEAASRDERVEVLVPTPAVTA